MVHPLVGKSAPSFSALNANGENLNFTPGSDGNPTVLFFFPQAGSFACNREVCQLQAVTQMESFKHANVQMLGVSADSVQKQKAFVEEKKLTYLILSDESGDIRKSYNIGRFLIWPSTRTTFVIDKNGTVRAVLNNSMNYAAHAKFVKKELDMLEAEEKSSANDEQLAEAAVSALDVTAITL